MAFKERPSMTAEEWAGRAPIKDAHAVPPVLDPDADLTLKLKVRVNPYLQDLLDRAARIERRSGASLVRAILIPALEAIVAGANGPTTGASAAINGGPMGAARGPVR